MFITKCRFVNCQAIVDKEIPFSSGLNVLLADNSVGKSILFKMLKASCGIKAFSSEDVKHLITYGKNEAIALWYFDDNSVGGVMITSRGNIYLYGDSDQNIGRWSEPHPDFLRNLSVVLDSKEDFVLNILDPDQELIFVNSKPSTNYTVVKLVASDERLEQLIINNDTLNGQLESLLRITEGEVLWINTELSHLLSIDISGVTSIIRDCIPLINVCRTLCSAYDLLDRVLFVSDLDVTHLLNCLDLVRLLQEIGRNVISVRPVKEFDPVLLLSLVDLVELLRQIINCLYVLEKNHTKRRSLVSELEKAQILLKEFVIVVECPIKGTVFYSEDGDCLLCDL